MSFLIKHRTFDFAFPTSEPPVWAGEVERWYQLDAFAFGLPQAASYWGLCEQLKTSVTPTHLVLASPEGSNRTDFDFARSFLKTGTGSPSKFVHTLPNSRSAALLQVLGWYGPLLCLQNDPSTLTEALMAAVDILRSTTRDVPARDGQARLGVWVFAVIRKDEAQFATHLFEVSDLRHLDAREVNTALNNENSGATTYFLESSTTSQRLTHLPNQQSGQRSNSLADNELLKWFDTVRSQAPQVAPALALNSKFQISLQFIADSQRTRT